MMAVHPSAIVETDSIGADVVIDAYCVVGPLAVVGDGVHLHPHVVVDGRVALGARTEVFPGAVLGRLPASSPSLSRVPDRQGAVDVGPDCSVGSHSIVYAGVSIGGGSLLGDFASIREQCRVGDRCIIGRGVSMHPGVTIGDGTRVYDDTHIATGSRIGYDCFIGVNVSMTSDNALGRLPYDPDRVRGATLGDRVIVASGAMILPHLVIGDDAIVGAGALVTRDVSAATTVRGQPARATREA